MARRRQADPPESHERWLVSYADFITILLAFFVVMYSISSVNEGKYRVLSDSLGSAFGRSSSRVETIDTLNAVLLDSPPAEASASSVMIPLLLEHQQAAREAARSAAPADALAPARADQEQSFTQQILDRAEYEIDGIATDVEREMSELIDRDIINIKRNKFWLEVEVKTSLLFTSGSSQLIPAAVTVLLKLSDIFAGLPNRIHVEGFTDDQPISTLVFPSNWELSAARAAAVVRLFEKNGVDPSRMASIGYGEYHPISGNDSAEGRARNRRVVMVVMASLEGQSSDRVYEFELLKEQAESLGDS
ncbi:MAG: flagellar motor protein MotD [Halioglobus sp.]|nr:flagellar motor protein MotD [Halioglobus sp.]